MEPMALSLSDEAQTQRWSVERVGAPTTLRLAQLRRVGSFSSDHEQGEEDVASVQHTAKGWQITRHAAAIDIAVQRDFGGFPGFTVRLRDPGAVALLCHRDTVTFSCAQTANEARLTVELSPGAATDDDEELSDAESEELCDDHGEAAHEDGGDEETADFVPEFQRLSQESAERFSQSQRSLGSQTSNADSAAPIGSQSSVGSACSWEEPDSLELDSGSDLEDSSDFAAAPRAAPDAGAAKAKAKASPAMIRYSQEERGATAQEPGGGMSAGALASSFALLGGAPGPAPMSDPTTAEVAREMEERVGASGEAAPWSCDSCHYLCSGLASSCELCSAPRGPPTAAAATVTDTIVDLTDDSVAATVPASTGGAKRDQARAQVAPKQQTKRRKLESLPRAQATANAATAAIATASAAAAVTATAVTASAAQAAASAARPAAAKQGKGRAGAHGQPDRRKTASDFKNGLGPLPPVTLNMDETVPSREVKVGGADGVLVHWPAALHPSRPQVCCEHTPHIATTSAQVLTGLCRDTAAAHAPRRGRARCRPPRAARKPDRHRQNACAAEHLPRHAVGAAGGGEGGEEALLAALGLCQPDTRTAGPGDARAQAPAVRSSRYFRARVLCAAARFPSREP